MPEVVKFVSKTAVARETVKKAVFAATEEVFNIDILAQAKQDSPVLSGNNRRSIDAEVVNTARGPEAVLFTQSGYGGYLEVGTARMKAQPYLYPAFEKFWNKIPTRVREILKRG